MALYKHDLKLPQTTVRIEKYRFFQQSHSDERAGVWYELTYKPEYKRWSCSCMDSQYRPEKRGRCKHITRLLEELTVAIDQKRGGGKHG